RTAGAVRAALPRLGAAQRGPGAYSTPNAVQFRPLNAAGDIAARCPYQETPAHPVVGTDRRGRPRRASPSLGGATRSGGVLHAQRGPFRPLLNAAGDIAARCPYQETPAPSR